LAAALLDASRAATAATIREGISGVGDKVAEKIAEVAIAPTAL
jgi:hypothetical protein